MSTVPDVNWRKQNSTIPSRLKVILRQQMFTDVLINIREKEFKCHSLILAIGSPYFERTFYHTFRSPSLKPITISDVTPQAFQCILTYLYTNEVTFGNEMQAFDTFEAASKFEVDDLKCECEIFLSELDFRPKTIWNNLARATALGMEKMQRKYTTYIESNTERCLQEDTFMAVSGDVMLNVVKSDKLAITEMALLNRVAAWGKNKNLNLSKKILKPYLCHIRFKDLTPKDFCIFVQNYPDLISSDDCLAILQYLEMPYNNDLPSWCCRQSSRIWP